MNQQETEQALKELNERLTNEIGKLVGTCNDLSSQIASLRKRVRRIEMDYYKDIEPDDESSADPDAEAPERQNRSHPAGAPCARG
jgi:hypothetical protein